MAHYLSQALAIAALSLGFVGPAAAQSGTQAAPQGYYYDINGNLRHIGSQDQSGTASGSVIYSGSSTTTTSPVPTPTTTYSIGTTVYPTTGTAGTYSSGTAQYPANTVGSYDYSGGITYDTPPQPPTQQEILYPVPTIPSTSTSVPTGVVPHYDPVTTTWIRPTLPEPNYHQADIQPLRWKERLGEFLPVIEACMARSTLHDLKATAIYQGRRGAPRVRMSGRSTSSAYSSKIAQDCVVRRGETRLRNISDGNAGLNRHVRTAYIPVGTRFVLPTNAVLTPVIDDRYKLIGWLVREARRSGDRLGEAIIIAGYPQK